MAESKQKEIEMQDRSFEIKSTKTSDVLAIVSKGVLGNIPFLGPLVA